VLQRVDSVAVCGNPYVTPLGGAVHVGFVPLNGLEVHHEKGLPDINKSQHFSYVI